VRPEELMLLAILSGFCGAERGWNKPSPTIEITPTMPPWAAHGEPYSTLFEDPRHSSDAEEMSRSSSFVFESKGWHSERDRFTGEEFETETIDARPTVPVPTFVFTSTPTPESEGDEL
jgi:hypothetical protein